MVIHMIPHGFWPVSIGKRCDDPPEGAVQFSWRPGQRCLGAKRASGEANVSGQLSWEKTPVFASCNFKVMST